MRGRGGTLQGRSSDRARCIPFPLCPQLYLLEEACKMFNKVLESKSTDEEARRLLGDCCAAMNGEYVRMKKIKRVERVRAASTPCCIHSFSLAG